MAKGTTVELRISDAMLLKLASEGKKFDDKTLQMLRCVCVHGENQNAVAKKYGVKPQFVSRAKMSLKKRMENLDNNNFVVRTIRIHPDLEAELDKLLKKSKRLEEKLKKQSGDD